MAWVTPGSVSDGSVLTTARWNQDVVDNTTSLWGATRVYESSQRTTQMTVTLTPTSIFATAATFPAVSGSLYRFALDMPIISLTASGDIEFGLSLGGAVATTRVWGYYANGTSDESHYPGPSPFYWTATATGNVTANVTAVKYFGTTLLSVQDSVAKLRVTGPLVVA